MADQSSLVQRHMSRSGPLQAKGDIPAPSSRDAVGGRQWSVKVANVIAGRYGFAISTRPPKHD